MSKRVLDFVLRPATAERDGSVHIEPRGLSLRGRAVRTVAEHLESQVGHVAPCSCKAADEQRQPLFLDVAPREDDERIDTRGGRGRDGAGVQAGKDGVTPTEPFLE